MPSRSIVTYMILVTGLLIAALAFAILAWISEAVRIWRRKRKRLLDLAAKLPGPKGLPLIGNALQFACKPEQFLERCIELAVPYQDTTPASVWVGPLLHVVVVEPRHIQVILNSEKSTLKGSVYRLLLPFFGDGLISGSDKTWRSHRKLFAPMLNVRTLKGFAEIVQKHNNVLVEKLEPVADGVEFDVGPHLTRCSIDAVCETVFGYRDMNAQAEPDQEFIRAVERMYEIFINRAVRVWLRPDRMFRLSSSYEDQKQRQEVIRNFTEKLIIAKQKELAVPATGESVIRDSERISILDQLIRKMEHGEHILDSEQLRDEIFTIYIAAQDTLAVIGSFTLLMLGIHKDVQENVRNELGQVLMAETENIPHSSLSGLKYLEMVIKETLRLFPIAPFLMRTIRSDLALDTCVLPEGCEVLVALYLTQRNPRFWKTPEKFIPERFIPEEIALRHPYAYVPFSGGLMGCIGQKFAMEALKLTVANVVRSYRIDSTVRLEDIKLKNDVSIRSINGFPISLKSLGPLQRSRNTNGNNF